MSVLNGENLRHLKMCDAKEPFVEQVEASGLDYCVIRPNGFFSDLSEFYTMAAKGRIYLLGSGNQKTNPIHGEDLAEVCIDAIARTDHEIKVGGPDTLTYNDIANLAFEAIGKETKVTHIPNWVGTLLRQSVRILTSSKIYGPVEFFLTVTAIDMIAPEYGKHTLKNFFSSLNKVNVRQS